MKELLKLAREAIKTKLLKNKLDIDEKIKSKYNSNQSCFVTLTKNNELRGCIGSLIASKSLYQDVIDNAINAAFNDPRFPPLSEQELPLIKIEISVLSIPKKLEYKDEQDLLNKINNNLGLILKKGFFSATFLPQVWDHFNNKVEFLEHLSIKAGLSKDAWKTAEFDYYTVNAIEES